MKKVLSQEYIGKVFRALEVMSNEQFEGVAMQIPNLRNHLRDMDVTSDFLARKPGADTCFPELPSCLEPKELLMFLMGIETIEIPFETNDGIKDMGIFFRWALIRRKHMIGDPARIQCEQMFAKAA